LLAEVFALEGWQLFTLYSMRDEIGLAFLHSVSLNRQKGSRLFSSGKCVKRQRISGQKGSYQKVADKLGVQSAKAAE
jgi:hypothetical protein